MRATFHLTGMKELQAALKELPKATDNNVKRRVLKKRLEPVAEAAAANATRRSGALAESFTVGTSLSARQAKLNRKMFKSAKTAVEMHVGAGPLPQAHLEEFGSVHNDPQPMLRPAWDEAIGHLLDDIGDDLWVEIKAAAARRARKQARVAKGT